MHIDIRRAEASEANELSALARASKAHWGYSNQQLDSWTAELNISADELGGDRCFVAGCQDTIAGFYLLNLARPVSVLQHFWVGPTYIGRGVGRSLLLHATQLANGFGADSLSIDSDPNAEGFYLACGAARTGAIAAPVDGDPSRVRPQLRLATDQTQRTTVTKTSGESKCRH